MPSDFPPRGRARACRRAQPCRNIACHQQRIGTTRTVVVTPAVYVTDNRVTLDAISQLGDNARGVAVVHPTVTDAELKALAAGGIRGIRFTQFDPATAVTTLDMIAPLSKRVNDLGWHVQIHMRGDQIVACRRSVAAPAIGHGVRPSGPAPARRPASITPLRHHPRSDRQGPHLGQAVRRLLEQQGRRRQLSGGHQGRAGLRQGGARSAWCGAATGRIRPASAHKPDDAVLFDLLAEWAPDRATRHRILVENPAALYGFA